MVAQVGDVAVLDISATTIDQDESNIKKIPSAESKGLSLFTSFTPLGNKGLEPSNTRVVSLSGMLVYDQVFLVVQPNSEIFVFVL